jgi:pimeloyl-ACP methyl ester carboxylesterase
MLNRKCGGHSRFLHCLQVSSLAIILFLILFLAAINPANALTSGVVEFHGADNEIDYNWFTYVPNSARNKQPVRILLAGIHGNLIDQCQYDKMTEESRKQISNFIEFSEEEGYAILTPVIPRKLEYGYYAVSFVRQTLDGSIEYFYTRPDWRVNSMIVSLRNQLGAAGYSAFNKVFVCGFSAGGMFTNRYPIINPSWVRAAAAGQAGGALTMPIMNYNGRQLEWPLGLFDFEELTGSPFFESDFHEIAWFVFTGSEDNSNSTLDYPGDVWTTEQINWLRSELGETDPIRLQNQCNILQGMGFQIDFKMYPGVGHQWTSEMFRDMQLFFRKHNN